MESLTVKTKVIMSEASKEERATTIPKGSTLEAIASGSAHNLIKTRINSLTNMRLKDSLTSEEIQSGGLLCENVKHVDKKSQIMTSRFNVKEETKSIIVLHVVNAIMKGVKSIITKTIDMNSNSEENIIRTIKINGKIVKFSLQNKKLERSNYNVNVGQKTDGSRKQINLLQRLSGMENSKLRKSVKNVERQNVKLSHIIQIMINLFLSNGFVKLVMQENIFAE